MKNKKSEIAMIVILTVISVLFIAPIIIVFMNSFKSKLYINLSLIHICRDPGQHRKAYQQSGRTGCK